MSYSSTNPVQTFHPRYGAAPALHIYRSTHAHAEIEAAGFFANGKRHGLSSGDALLNIPYSTDGSSAATWHIVSGSTGAIAASDTAGSSAYAQAYNVSVTVAST